MSYRHDTKTRMEDRIAELREQGYVTARDLFEEDTRMRRNFCLPPRANLVCMQTALCQLRRKIRTVSVRRGRLNMYHHEDALDALCDMYDNDRSVAHCRANTHRSRQDSHLEATPAILADPNYQPREFLVRYCHIAPNRINKLTSYNIIIPYWDTARRCLLYPVDQVLNRAAHHPLKTIRKYFGAAYAEHIKATRPHIHWNFGGLGRKVYYCPECPSV